MFKQSAAAGGIFGRGVKEWSATMGPLYTAIIHLREPATPIVQRLVLPALATVRGIGGAEYDPAEALLAITFDGEEARLPDIIRIIEDAGSPVAAVGQRLVRVARKLSKR